MQKIILSLSILSFIFLYSPAMADDKSGIDLNLGGSFRGYVNYTNQDGAIRSTDILRETEMMLSGKTKLDNGLTFGVNILTDVDAGDSFALDESYIYISGDWGRINFGDEDGAAYTLQVSAPAADENVDGIRPKIRQFNGARLNVNYANSATKDTDKITYLTPKFSGLQMGATYTPTAILNGTVASRGIAGNSLTNGADLKNIHEIAARYEGKIYETSVIIGAGYTKASQETNTATNDDFEQWNIASDIDVGAFGFGAVYTENNNASAVNNKNEIMVFGGDYKTGPYKFGASYLNRQANVAGIDTDTNRYAIGAQYAYGTGMSFRSTVAYADVDARGLANDTNATIVTIGTQIDFLKNYSK